MKLANFEPIFTDEKQFCERSSSKPIETFVPHQAISLKELVSRFERGQRLNVKQNFLPGDNFYRGSSDDVEDQRIVANDFAQDEMRFEQSAPDDVHDVVDVHDYYRDHLKQKSEYEQRMKEKKEEAKKAKQAPAPQANQADSTPPPVDPANPPA